MILAQSFFAAAGLASLAYLTGFCFRPPSLAKSVLKTLATLFLAIAAFVVDAPALLVVALALGALGDLALSRDGEPAFLTGLIAFALSHLAYVALFVLNGDAGFPPPEGWPQLAGLGLLAFGGAIGRLLWSAAGVLRWPVLAYIGIIIAMGLGALGIPPDEPGRGIALCAATLFVMSDAILASEIFLLDERHPARRYTPFAIWTTYWLAQALFLLAFSGIALG